MVRLRKALLAAWAGLLGAAVVVLPAAAGSEGAPEVEALNRAGGGHEWSPAQASVGTGGTVTISNNSSSVPHGVEWVSGPATPSCSGVPGTAGQPVSGTSWKGTCTFSQPGTYTFYCTVHGPEMTGTITVAANGTTTTTMTMPATGTGTGAQPPAPGYQPAGQGQGEAPGSPSGKPGSPLAGDAASAVKVAATQRGRVVRGSVAVSQTGVGGRLEVQLLTTRAALAAASGASGVRVGRIVRSHLAAATVSFSVALSARARSALARHGRLSLSVRIVLTPAYGAATTVSRSVRLRKNG